MHQGEKHGADRRQPGPAVAEKQRVQIGETVKLCQRPRRHIAHDYNRHYNLIGGEAKDKGHQDKTVQAEQSCKRV